MYNGEICLLVSAFCNIMIYQNVGQGTKLYDENWKSDKYSDTKLFTIMKQA